MGRIWAHFPVENHRTIEIIESGGWAGVSTQSKKSAGDDPHIFFYIYIAVSFLDTFTTYAFFNIFKIKWSKSEETLNFGGRCVLVSQPVTLPLNQNFMTDVLEDNHSTSFVDNLRDIFFRSVNSWLFDLAFAAVGLDNFQKKTCVSAYESTSCPVRN